MTRFVVDAGAALQLAGEGVEVAAEHELLAPTLLRSQVLSELHEAVHRGELTSDVARERLAAIRALKIRLLGDAVLQQRHGRSPISWAGRRRTRRSASRSRSSRRTRS